ncbi:MAG: hypothetical protein IIZ61_07000 [Lachnospiraceae bacterium]|nr:hypothetical protein [Lachnospiraceae bacterium]
MKREFLNVLRRFINICGCTLIIMVVIGPLLRVIDGINNIQIGFLTICSGAAALSSLMFISKKELHGTAWWIREILCILINMAITLPLTHYAGLWHSTGGMIIVMIIVIVIAFGNHLIEFLSDMRTADQINKKIKELR